MLIEPILKLPNRYNIITKHGIIANLHHTANAWYQHEKDSVFMHEFVNYIIKNYSTFKTKK